MKLFSIGTDLYPFPMKYGNTGFLKFLKAPVVSTVEELIVEKYA